MVETQPTALVVEPDVRARDEIGGWLEAEGFDVLVCPGPSAPDYSCPGGRDESCPLTEGADVVVLDLHLASDAEMRGVPGFELLFYYGARDKPVVVLSDDSDAVAPLAERGLEVVARPARRRALVTAVGRALAYGHSPMGRSL